jgi:3',5'-cyclic AMP phosphodiesterase CpdA
MIIDAIGCTHGEYPQLEGGDLLIITGDCTANDSVASWGKFFDWLDRQNYKKKVLVAGNHDNFCKSWNISGAFTEDEYDKMYPDEKPCLHYLCDSGIEFEGLNIWGSPWTLTFPGINPHCDSFTGNEDLLEEKFALIPENTDILISHGPPFGIFDKTRDDEHVGSQSLRAHVIDRVKPRLHVFSHIHECGGKNIDMIMTRFINCSVMNEHYKPVNKPVRVVI